MPGPAGAVPEPWRSLGYRNSENGALRAVSVPLLGLGTSSVPWARLFCLHLSSVGLVLHDDLSAQVYKRFVHICSPPGAGFEVGNIPFT
jgi:hypothetical protein